MTDNDGAPEQRYGVDYHLGDKVEHLVAATHDPVSPAQLRADHEAAENEMSEALWKEMLDAIGDTPVRLWFCPDRRDERHREHDRSKGTVEWRDGVAYCLITLCGRTSLDRTPPKLAEILVVARSQAALAYLLNYEDPRAKKVLGLLGVGELAAVASSAAALARMARDEIAARRPV